MTERRRVRPWAIGAAIALFGVATIGQDAPAATTTAKKATTKKATTTKKGAAAASGATTTTAKRAAGASGASTTAATTATLAVLRIPKIDILRATAANTTFAAADDGSSVVIGDRLKTDGKGKGYVDFADGSILRVATTTEVSVTDLAMTASARRVKVSLTTGTVYARVAKATGSETEWSIDTPAGVATARGTAFSVTCTATTCTVAVSEGVVAVANPQGTVNVNAGQETTATRGQAPITPKPLDTSADPEKGNWLICNSKRDGVVTPNASFANPGDADCLTSLGGPALPAVPGFTFAPLVPGTLPPPATGTGTAATTTTTTGAPTTTVPATTTTTTFPTRPSFFTGSGGLTATMIENPFRCNGAAARPYVNYTGLVPGESLTWVWGIAGQPPDRTGSSSAGGTTGFSVWSCTPAQAGTVWTITMTGGSGHSITYDLVGGPP